MSETVRDLTYEAHQRGERVRILSCPLQDIQTMETVKRLDQDKMKEYTGPQYYVSVDRKGGTIEGE